MDAREELIERTDLVNPQRRIRPSEQFSDTRSGSGRAGRSQFSFDGHRDQHIAQLDDRFARTALAMLRELIDERPTQRVVIGASPRMLGRLRASAPGILPHDMAIDEIPRNLVEDGPAELRAALEAHGALPARSPSHGAAN